VLGTTNSLPLRGRSGNWRESKKMMSEREILKGKMERVQRTREKGS
jgi:hypothetical protein